MSLISIRNFAAPFSKKGQLFTILLVVILFTILRLSLPQGRGVIELQDRGSFFPTGERFAPRAQPQIVPQNNAAVAPQNAQAGSVAAPAARPQSAPAANDDVFFEIFGGGSSSKAPPANADAKGGSQGGLDDIEQKLGLR